MLKLVFDTLMNSSTGWIGILQVSGLQNVVHCGIGRPALVPRAMYLYLGHHPRVLYLVTSSYDERLGRPRRALVFRAGENSNQVVVEFLQKDQVDLTNTVRLTSRVVKGCMGLISMDNGSSSLHISGHNV